MDTDPIGMCELLVGLGEVEVLGVDDVAGDPLRVHVRCRAPRPSCSGCGGALWSNGERAVELVDLPAFGQPVRLVWHKRRWRCPRHRCEAGTVTEQRRVVAPPRALLQPILDNCYTLIDEVRSRGWICGSGKTPTVNTWVRELPTFSTMMENTANFIPMPPGSMRTLNSVSSRSVHTDPVTVVDDDEAEGEIRRKTMACGATPVPSLLDRTVAVRNLTTREGFI